MSPHVWWKMMTKAEHLQWWIDHLDGAPAVSVKHDLTCNPIGISSLVSKVAGSLVQAWNRHLHSSDSSTDVGCSSESESDDDSVSAMRSFLFHGTTGKRLWQSWVSPAYRLCFPVLRQQGRTLVYLAERLEILLDIVISLVRRRTQTIYAWLAQWERRTSRRRPPPRKP